MAEKIANFIATILDKFIDIIFWLTLLGLTFLLAYIISEIIGFMIT